MTLHLWPPAGIASAFFLGLGALAIVGDGEKVLAAMIGVLGAALFLLAAVVGQP